MKPIPLQSIAEFSGGVLRRGDGSRRVESVCTDSRKIEGGQVFVALSGERFDGHDYIPQVAQGGAAALVVSRLPDDWESLPCAVIEVSDTLTALQRLAASYRKWHNPRVIGITGSNGKTSTKDFTRAVMEKKFQVCATRGNLNNHIGVPLSILSLREGDDCGIFEMGTNHHGEIKVLADIATPDTAIITNIGVAHIEFLGSREGIAQEKGMLAESVPADGCVILNAKDEFTPSIAARCKGRVITAGVAAGEVSARDLAAEPTGTTFTLDFGGECVPTFLPVPGEHMVGNAALAAAAGWRHGIPPRDIADALRHVKLTGGRLETRKVGDITFLDDSYNANPDSMRAGLQTLMELRTTGRKVAVLGHMGELGIHTLEEHQALGRLAASLPLAAVITVGTLATSISEAARAAAATGSVFHFDDQAECAAFLRDWLRAGDMVLLKGSRSAGIEKVLAHYQAT